jgi:hypothetical protein
MKRWILNIGKYRPDRADGCEEKLDFTFLKFIPFLTGSKTPTSRFERSKEDKWEITARKDPTKDRTSKSGESHRTWRFKRDKSR